MAKARDGQVIDELRYQADARHLFAKSKLVANKLGNLKDSYWDDVERTTVRVFNDAASSLAVTCENTELRGGHGHSTYYAYAVEVFSEGKRVFKAYDTSDKGGVNGYIPGDWETQLEALYSRAQQPVAPKRTAEKAKRKWWDLRR